MRARSIQRLLVIARDRGRRAPELLARDAAAVHHVREAEVTAAARLGGRGHDHRDLEDRPGGQGQLVGCCRVGEPDRPGNEGEVGGASHPVEPFVAEGDVIRVTGGRDERAAPGAREPADLEHIDEVRPEVPGQGEGVGYLREALDRQALVKLIVEYGE